MKNSTDVASAVQLGMQKRKLNTPQLALKISEKPDVIRKILSKDAAKPSTTVLIKLEKVLGVKLLGKDNIGEPTEKGKKMDEEDEAARKAEVAKEAANANKTVAGSQVEETQDAEAAGDVATV